MSRKAYLRTSAVALGLAGSLSLGLVVQGGTAFAADPADPAVTAVAGGEYGGAGQPVGAAQAPAAGASSAAASVLALAVTRSEAIRRAKTWVGIGLDYTGPARTTGTAPTAPATSRWPGSSTTR
ncbi:hypothetical protein ACFYUY_06600 [Kitasatospora sp. NPDC004745]|uniref:hypothetical protein n=1 Tax=Kitasatospora sp. NPDC004745 TaxID=3364019 RepID=UPI0036B937D5